MHELYRTTHKIFLSGKPELGQELNKGLVLALGGFCQQREKFLFRVNKNFVTMRDGKWRCNCPQGEGFGVISELYGHAGFICQHVCAVAIAFSVNVWAEQPKNILEYLERLVVSDYVFDCQLPNSKVLIAVKDDNQAIIKLEHKKSGTLAIKNNGKWVMVKDALGLYRDFVNDLQS